MTWWQTSSQELDDTLTYVELVNSFIIAGIRMSASAKWSRLRGSWEGICNLVRSIVEWQSRRRSSALLTKNFWVSFRCCPSCPPSPSHLFELPCLLCDPERGLASTSAPLSVNFVSQIKTKTPRRTFLWSAVSLPRLLSQRTRKHTGSHAKTLLTSLAHCVALGVTHLSLQ